MNITSKLQSASLRHAKTDDGRFFIASHLDLKGVQLRPQYLPQLLCDLKAQGADAVLVEYEDVFPFENLRIASDPATAWSREALRDFLHQAKILDLEVIPLQQCLGHLEYVFCWDELRPFALDEKYPSTLDIFNADAKALIADMLRQVIEAHPDSAYVHLGLDEAFALVQCAEKRGASVCRWFVEYTETLCDICEEYGKTPLIWSDIPEHHLVPEDLPIIARLKNRALICTWDYTTRKATAPLARWGGSFVSRNWLQVPRDAAAPALTGTTCFVDEMPAALNAQLQPYREGENYSAIFQADLWTQMGFETLGTTASRVSFDGPVLPFYNWRQDNIELWAKVAARSGQTGIIVSSWARGTSWCCPNFSFDLSWPLIHAMACAAGKNPPPFFAGLTGATVERIFQTLGRCREDWKREDVTADEMETLTSQLQAHEFEWNSAILMARLLGLHKRVIFAVMEVEDFWANHRPLDAEWQRRLDDQSDLLRELAAMRAKVVAHFSQRYWGKAFDEWIATLFDIYEIRLRRCEPPCREKLEAARRQYSADGTPRYRRAVPAEHA